MLADEGKEPYWFLGVFFAVIFPFAVLAFSFWFIFIFLAQFK